MILRPPNDKAGTECPGRSLGAKRGEKGHQEQNGRRVRSVAGLTRALTNPVRRSSFEDKEQRGGRREGALWMPSGHLGAQIGIGGARAPTKRYKITPLDMSIFLKHSCLGTSRYNRAQADKIR